MLCLFPFFFHNRKNLFHIGRFVISFVVDLGICQRTIVPKRLKRSLRNVQEPAYVLIIQPLFHIPVSMQAAKSFHPACKIFEFREHSLECFGIYIDYLHCFIIKFIIHISLFSSKITSPVPTRKEIGFVCNRTQYFSTISSLPAVLFSTFRWRSKTEKFVPPWILNQVAVFGTDLDVCGIEVPYFSSSFLLSFTK